MYTGPHIIKDGLVFGYDTGYGIADNVTGTRFYPGKPTINLLEQSGAGSLDIRTDIYNNVTKTDLGNGKYKFVNDGTGTTTIRLYANVNDLVDGNYYGCSVSYEELNVGGYVHLDWCDTTNTSFTQASYGSANRIHIYGARSTYNSTFRFFDISLPVNGSVVLFDAQIELARPSPFVNGTRSSTASLIDLKETTDIDVSNVSFDSTGQPDFDGTNDYLDLGSDVTFKGNGGDWSAEHIVKYDVVPAGYNNSTSPGNFLGGTVNYNSWYWSVLNRKLALWNRSPGVWKYGSTTLEANKFYHVVLVCEPGGTSYKMYLNGVEEGGTNASYVYNASHSGISARYFGVGYAPSTRVVNGKIPVTRIYEKALSATEIKQNFNAYKNRFDI